MENRIDQIKKAIAAGIVFLLILTAVAVVIKYNEEGEDNMPFELSKITVISTVTGDDSQIDPTSIENSIIQNNDVYFEIKRNENYRKEAIIKSVEISNIQIINKPIKGEVKTYIPNPKEGRKFIYSDEYILDGNSLTYKGAGKSDTTSLQINNQGGTMVVSFGNKNVGKYQLVLNEEVTIDGKMLKNLGISEDDIKFSVNFDLIINTEKKTFKSNITLDLPAGNIVKDGISSTEITDTSKYVFKRVAE